MVNIANQQFLYFFFLGVQNYRAGYTDYFKRTTEQNRTGTQYWIMTKRESQNIIL